MSRLSRLLPGSGTVFALVLTTAMAALVTPSSRGAEAVAEPSRGAFELPGLRTAYSRTVADGEGRLTTTVASVPLHFRDGPRGWKPILSRLIASERAGFAWRNDRAAFKADLKAESADRAVRFEAGSARLALTLEGAERVPAVKERESGLVYKNVLAKTDIEYALLPTGLKETLVLKRPGAPNEFVFRVEPVDGSQFTLERRRDGGIDVRTPGAAEPAAVISAPIVNDSRPITISSAGGGVAALADSLAAAGKAWMVLAGDAAGGYRITLRIDRAWLDSPARVYPVKLDPTVTTAVDLQDGYWNMQCAACVPETVSNALVVSKDGTGSYSNGTTQHSSGIVFSLGDIPAGATITSARLDMYQTGCYPGSCGFFYPENGIGQSGQVEIRRFSGPWGSSTPTSALMTDSTVLASRGFAMQWNADQPGQWKSWSGTNLTSHIQDIVTGASPNYGIQAALAPAYYGWGPVFASSESADPNLAPKLEIQWVADGVQLNPSTNVHSDGPELTWSRFATGYGPYPASVLQDSPRAYWRMNDAAGSPFGLADWSGNSLHASPIGVAHGQTGATADGDTAVYFNGSSSRTEASESQITDTFTVEAWIKRGALGGKQTIFSRGESNGGGFRLAIDTNNTLVLTSGDYDGGAFRIFARSSTTIADTNTWHHVAATKSGQNVKLYIDGTDVTTIVETIPTLTSGLGMVVTGAAIGSDYVNGGRWYAEHFNGWIDEPAVYASVLPEARLDAHIAAKAEQANGFQRFEIHRSLTSGFTPSAASLIATVRDPAIQYYRDTSAKAATTFYYKIVTVGTNGSYTSKQLPVITPAAGNGTITVQPGVSLLGAEATTLASGSTCANNGGAGGITASSSQRGLIRFDLRQIPTGSQISSATLSLWTFQDGGGRTIKLHSVTGDWTEGSGTGSCDGSGSSWKDRQPNLPWSAEGGDFDPTAAASFTSSGSTPHWETASLTALVQDWVGAGKPNLGLIVKHETETGAPALTWTSDEYSGSAALRPKLEITYEDGSDPKEPTVAIGAPGDDAKLSGAVTVTAAAGDDSKVTQVEFLRDGTVFATDTSAPWQASLNTTALPRGTIELKARASDDVGQVTTSSPIAATVANSSAPTTSITGTTGTASLTVAAAAADDFSVSKVEFYVDGERFGSDGSSPYQAALDTLAFPVYDGPHTLTTRAYDADGNTTSSAGYPITVANTTGTKYQAQISATETQGATTEVPVGTILPYAGTTGSIPSGWAPADGSALSRSAYNGLFDAIGVAYGPGDGSTTFNLPDLRGRFPLGKATAGTGSTLGGTGGSLSMGGGTTTLPAIISLSFPTPPVTFSAGAVPAFSPTGFSFPTGYHYNYWTGDSALAGASVGSGGGLSAGWTTFSMPSQTATSGTVTPTASLSTATAAYRVVNYIVKTTAAAATPTCALWPSARTSPPAGSTPADGSTATGALAACLAGEYAGSTPDLRGRFPLGKTASGTAATLNEVGGARDFTHTITRNVPAATVNVPNYATSLTVPGGSYPASYSWYGFGQGNGTDVWLFRCSGGSGNGTCLPANATTPSVATPSANGGGGGPFTSTTTSDQTTTPGYNPAYLALDYYSGATTPTAGTLAPYGGSSPPTGWLIADGGCLSQTTYAALYAAIGSTYGSCPAGEFKLPNLQGRLPLGKAATGTGNTLGETGGSLDLTPAAALGSFTVAFDWTPSSFSFSVPARTATLNLGSNYDHQYAGSTYPSVLWNGSGSFSSTAFGATSFTATASPAGARTVTSTPAGATTATFPAEQPPYQTVNYLVATGPITGVEAFIPSEVRYDPSGGTQEPNRTTVELTNSSAVTWQSGSVFLRYRWIAPDGSTSNSASIPLGADVAPATSRSVQVDFDPPTLPSGVLRSLYRLRFDLVDTSSGSVYFAGQGNKPLERQVLVTAVTPLELGLERYQQYEPLDLGGGMTASANLASGNLVVSGNLLDNPGRGLATLVDLAYNSQEPGSFTPGGNGVTIGTGLARLGQPLDIHPNPSDTALGRAGKWIGFADSDGSYHRFLGRPSTSGKTYYDEPAGVHLYLRATGSADPSKYWALTRPDRTSFYFNEPGWPTRVEDANGNALVYTLADVASGEDAYGLAKRVSKITDAGGRDATLAYYAKAESPTTAVRGKLKSLTDHAGRVTRFDYYDDGNLLRVTQVAGVGDDGSYSAARSLLFAYTSPAGSGPAIATLAARQNPDPSTNQGRLLYSLIDYRGNESSFTYSTAGATANRLASWTDRAGKTTGFSYNTAIPAATVARPLARTSSYEFDPAGRVTEITNPLGLTTTIGWTAGNNVGQVTNDTTARSTSFAYNANGYLTSSTDEKGNETRLTYENLAVDADDASANWPAGRSIPHTSQLDTQTLPKGVASSGDPTDYQWSFDYTATGNLATVTDPLEKVTSNTYNADGTLATTTLPVTGDGITRTTTYETYDANGLPTQVKDAAGNRAKAGYGADGRPLWEQDPIHYGDSGTDTRSYRQTYDYDGYGRLIRSSSPKSSSWARGVLSWNESRYDVNDNLIANVAPYYALEGGGYGATTTSVFDPMDRELSVVGPDSSSGGTEETRTDYDDGGRPFRVIEPKGVRTTFADDYATITDYDLLDRPATVTRHELDELGAIVASKTRTTAYCYDAAGDLRSITGPKGAVGFSCPSATAWPYTPTTQPYTTKLGYDAAHQQTSSTDPLGRTSTTEYDANGWAIKETDPLSNEQTTEYDERGQAIKTVEPFTTLPVARSLTTLTEYDALGNVTKEVTPRAYDAASGTAPFTQFVTSYSYDALEQVVRVSLPKASAETQSYTHNAYDPNGRLVWTSLPTLSETAASVAAAEKTVNEYWDSGQLYSTTVGGAPKVRYDSTAEGWQAWRLPETAEGTGVADYARMMFWEYYADGLLKAERDLSGQRSSYAYDANGNQTSASEAQSIAGDVLSITSGFNGFDELLQVRTPKTGTGNSWVSSYSYDLHGNVATLIENEEDVSSGADVPGRTFSYSYDVADRPVEQTDDFATAGVVTDDERYSFEFDELGQLSKRTIAKRTGASTYATEQTQDSTYYRNGLPQTLITKDGAASPNTIASHSLSYLQAGIYLNGNKAEDVFRVANPDTGAPCRTTDCTASWEYDGRDRLSKASDGLPSGTTSEYTLDPAGNVTLEKRNGSSYRTASYTGQRLTTDTAGGLSSRYLYDAQGNVDCVVLASWAASSCPTAATGQSVASELLSDNVYDYRDRLVAVRSYNGGSLGDKTEYRYDPLSRPVKKTATEGGTTTATEMVYLGAADAVVRETETGATTKVRSYAFDQLGDRATISETVSGTTSRYSYVYDPLGSAELLLDQANTVKAAYGYTAYGDANPQLTKTAAGFTPNTNLYRYTGKRWDPAAKAYDMGARHYFPAQGRWFQQDTYADALDNLGLSTDPLNSNRYLFTGANPINYVEIDGHGFREAWDTLRGRGSNSRTNHLVKRTLAANDKYFGGPIDRTVKATERTIVNAHRAKNEWMERHPNVTTALMILAGGKGAGGKGAGGKTFQTYTKAHPNGGPPYIGRTSGTGKPAQNVARRDSGHHMKRQGFGPAKLDKSSKSSDAIRGREDQLVERYGGAKSSGGTSSNQNRPISPRNPKRDQYLNAARRRFGK